jgi:hypothetical protein
MISGVQLGSQATRRLFAPRTWPGWAFICWSVIGLLWKGANVWSTIDFLLTNLPRAQEAFRSIAEAIPGYFTATTLQWAVLIIGLGWLFVTTGPVRALTVGDAAASIPKRRSHEERRQLVAELVGRALRNGEALHASYDWGLVREWERRTSQMLEAAIGPEEAARFMSGGDGPSRYPSPYSALDERAKKLKALQLRLEFTKIREDFDPTPWQQP